MDLFGENMRLFKKCDGIEELVRAGNRVNCKRNRILTVSVAVAIVVLFSAFSIARGKITIDSIRHIREHGSVASAILENANEEQYQKIKDLDYVECVGQEHILGKWYQKDLLFATCAVMDQTGYEKIVSPAYDGIVGRYPERANEIMLSKKLLKRLGIFHPRLGMEVLVPISFSSWSVNDGYELTQTFVLSGYYNDYMEEAERVPIAYFSNTYLQKIQIAQYPASLLMKCKSEFLNGDQIEKRLYRDVTLTDERQQLVGIDSGDFEAVKQGIGGYGMAVLITAVFLLSVYLLIYNVLSISFSNDIRYYGLLFTIGLTQKQARKLVLKQMVSILIKGSFLGIVFSMFLGVVTFPSLFQGLFLQQKGEILTGMVLYPDIMIKAILFVAIVVLVAVRHTTGKFKKLSPIEAYGYREETAPKAPKTGPKMGASVERMAWRNLFCSKRKFTIALLSLFLGCQTALLTVFIMNGTDIMNEMVQKPDFEIGTNKDAVEKYLFSDGMEGFQPDTSEALLDEAFMDQIVNMEELDQSSVNITYGFYGDLDYHEKFIEPNVNAAYGTGTSNTAMTIQVVNDHYIQKLENYAKRNRLNIDTVSLRKGKGILVLHKHELSETLKAEAEKLVGEPAHVYSMDNEGAPKDKGVKFVCAGYLDTTQKDFPSLNMSWNGNGINYFLIGERGAKRLQYPKQVFHFTINAKEGQEETAKMKLTGMIREKNTEHEEIPIYYISSTSDEIRQAQNYVRNSRVVMTALCLSLFLLGIINYLNVIITNIISRKKEFAVMQSIGMTKKQLKKMLIAEGIYYWAILLTVLLSIGTLITLGVGVMIQKNVPYFRFVYPAKELVMGAIILLLFCVSLPQTVYKKIRKKSAVEELRGE